jgi:peptidoglycan-associated lipoprotein
MKKNAMMILLVCLAFCLSMISISGCAKKSAIQVATPLTADESMRKQAAAEAELKVVESPREEKIVKPEVSDEALKSEEAMKREAEAVKKKAAPAPAPAPDVVARPQMFDNIYFNYDQYDLNAESRAVLTKVADFLKNNPKYILRIEGHCDERGTAEYNLALGQRRADEAMKYLLKLGINADRITTLSYGEELPLDPEQTEEAWAKNRRANFVPILTR